MGTAVLIAIFSYVNSNDYDMVINAVLKSLPGQYLCWCIFRDTANRIKENKAKGDKNSTGDIVS